MELHLISGHRTLDLTQGFIPTVQTGPLRVREAWCLFMILFRLGQSWDWNQQSQPRAHAPTATCHPVSQGQSACASGRNTCPFSSWASVLQISTHDKASGGLSSQFKVIKKDLQDNQAACLFSQLSPSGTGGPRHGAGVSAIHPCRKPSLFLMNKQPQEGLLQSVKRPPSPPHGLTVSRFERKILVWLK